LAPVVLVPALPRARAPFFRNTANRIALDVVGHCTTRLNRKSCRPPPGFFVSMCTLWLSDRPPEVNTEPYDASPVYRDDVVARYAHGLTLRLNCTSYCPGSELREAVTPLLVVSAFPSERAQSPAAMALTGIRRTPITTADAIASRPSFGRWHFRRTGPAGRRFLPVFLV
jgi:hypothetical protein